MVGEHMLEFIVQDQHQGTADASPEIAQVTLEKSCDSFLAHNFSSAIHRSTVLLF